MQHIENIGDTIYFRNIGTSNVYIQAVLSCSLISQSNAGNTSVLHAELRMSRSNDERTWCYEDTTNAWITINGQTCSNCPHFDITYQSDTLMVEGDFTVDHAADGTCRISIESGFESAVVNMDPFSDECSIRSIARASTLRLPDDGDLGSAVHFTIDRGSDAFLHDLTYAFNGTAGTIATGIATALTWTPPLSMAAAIPDKSVQECLVTCTTKYNGTVIGSHTNRIRLHVPVNVVPVITEAVLSDPNGYPATHQSYIQNKSCVTVTTKAAGVYGSAVVSVQVSLNGKTYTGNTVTSDVLTASGSLPVNITVTDSRARTASLQKTIQVLPYAPPQINSSFLWRCTQDGTDADDGNYCLVKWVDTVHPDWHSSRSVQLSYKKAAEGDAAYKAYTGSFTQQTSAVQTTVLTDPIPMSSDDAYTIRITVSDALDTAVRILTLSTGYTVMDIDGSGKKIAFGKVADTDGLEIALPTTISNRLNLTGTLHFKTGAVAGLLMGSGTIAGQKNDGWTQKTISFGTAFPVPPKVFLQQTGETATENMRLVSTETTGFTVALYGCNGCVNAFDWLAVAAAGE